MGGSWKFTESDVEEAALSWFAELGYHIVSGPTIAPDGQNPERLTYQDVVLTARLFDAIARLNPAASQDARDEALRRLTQLGSPSLVLANRDFHKLFVDGIEVEILRDGEQRGEHIRFIDFDDPANNDWLAVNQFTIVGETERRPDVVIFVNGIPLAVIEFKNMADPGATIDQAYNQLQTYQLQIPRLFQYNALLMISDGAKTWRGSSIFATRSGGRNWPTASRTPMIPSASSSYATCG